ncbi:SsrA-binding protein SmpB [Myxococcota bacterium]|nr:SsrA-binding protein SmpB [Myxococcota bacterium]
MAKPNPPEVIARNRRARHDYEVLDTFEAGMSLLGPEVKSLRAGLANLGDSYAVVRGGECFLEKLHISPYEAANRENGEPMRTRRLLLHGHEIRRLAGKVRERGLTLIPLSLYWKDGRAKVELGLVRGKRNQDRREDIKQRDAARETQRALRDRGRRGGA